jgi:hypothetical protein
MKRTFLALSWLALVLLAVLVVGAGLGMAQSNGPVKDARPTPTPVLPLPTQAPPSPIAPEIPPLPDLIVESIEVLPATPRIGDTVRVLVTIKNRSQTDVEPGNNFWTDLYVDPAVLPIQLGQHGVYEWPCQATWVPAGGSHILTMEYVFDDVKTFSLYAQVDTDNHVQEANENNNVLGPVTVEVLGQDQVMHQTHREFQLGMASGLDISHPRGVIRRGIFRMPFTEPEIYTPDIQIDHPGPPSGPTTVNQTRPALASSGTGILFAVWEDGRNGGVFNRDVFFSRSTDGGSTWQEPDVPVSDDVGNQIRPDLAYDPDRGPSGRLYAVWQDEREGNYDIYFAYSDDAADPTEPIADIDWQGQEKLNDDTGVAAQLNPSIALGPEGEEVYVVWQDQRNGNDDIYLVRYDYGTLEWSDNYFVTDDPDTTAQNQMAPSISVESAEGRVVVAWEDWRDPLHPEIYSMWSVDKGETFGIDVPITIVPPEDRTTYRRAPSVAAQTTIETIEYWDETQEITKSTTTSITAIHVGWQDGPEDQADVYYAYASFIYDFEAREECPYPYETGDDDRPHYCFGAPQKLSGFVIDSDYALPPEPGPIWPIEPSWQGQVSLDLVPDGPSWWTYCHAGSTQVYSRGVVVAWSDARSYDDWRYEIRTRRVASPEGDPKVFEPCEDWMIGHVNDNAKLYPLRDNPVKYKIYQPAATGQFNPSIVADDSGVFVAWDDDRWDDPTVTGTVRNRDVFMAQMGSEPEGIFISPVIDGGAVDPKWYVLSWWGVTEHGGDVLFQTRFGDDPYPPKEGTASGGWTAWTGNASSGAYVDPVECPTGSGEGCVYDAPGRRIVDPDGDDWFDCDGATCPGPYRYMQYKVIQRGPSRRTAVSRVVVHYDGGIRVYLPIVLKAY